MSILLKRNFERRSVLRGMLGGTAVTVALPLLDCFLDDNGTALASGAPMPVRFGTWFWGLGQSPGFGASNKGKEIVLGREVAPLEAVRAHMNYFGGFTSPLDGNPNLVHYSGTITCRTGTSPAGPSDIPAPTFDVLIADMMSEGSRFPMLNMACSGGARNTYSARSNGQRNAAEPSPVQLYAQIFGPEFVDPNRLDFKPDPKIMVEKSVLSSVSEHAKRVAATLGSADKERLDAHFTAIRQLEQQLSLQLEKPPANDACRPKPVAAGEDNLEKNIADAEIDEVTARHNALTQIMVMALACNQTKVFNMVFSNGGSALRRAGDTDTHHTLSHNQPVDKTLGYQPDVAYFNLRSMEALSHFVQAFSTMREGDRTLLDNTFIVAHTDTSDAKVHSVDGLPVFSFGRAGGRIKTGLYIGGNGDPLTRIGLTSMQLMGVPIDTWGTKSAQASKAIREIFV
jgi:hypothetical protein